jgi:hypothetical protein
LLAAYSYVKQKEKEVSTHMAELNPQLAQIARDVIAEMREWGCPDDDIQWSASGAILKHCEAQGIEDADSTEKMAAILALVKQVLKEPREPTLRQCPYCLQMHQVEHIEQCPLKPR